ncbi:MAG: peptidoglycan bridge formation glycyltransferase FemA/FemB family protein [Candidatus Moranbacteria bacterium]|nr:peptidoglycan bridge formation glycyltransferase FemA/FemB family protein [Candidatus Moranbacteria bacterium]
MMGIKSTRDDFIQKSSPDGGFLQSEHWSMFQESFGRKTFHIEQGEFWANIIEHKLPVVGSYFYIPRGPIIGITNYESGIRNKLNSLVGLAKENKAGWIRIEPANKEVLESIEDSVNYKITKTPHDMQPKEILILDVTKSEEELLTGMKPKTRYNIRLAEKKSVSLRITNPYEYTNSKAMKEFLRLVKITAKRDKITSHPEGYYRKMFETIPGGILKLYIAEYEGKIIAANIVIFFGKTATYLHGASDYEYRNIMAPYLLQWRAILDAKKAGCEKYDLGGIRSCNMQHETCNKDWQGITRFKTGFAPTTHPLQFLGSYDIIINPMKYWAYRSLQKIKSLTR